MISLAELSASITKEWKTVDSDIKDNVSKIAAIIKKRREKNKEEEKEREDLVLLIRDDSQAAEPTSLDMMPQVPARHVSEIGTIASSSFSSRCSFVEASPVFIASQRNLCPCSIVSGRNSSQTSQGSAFSVPPFQDGYGFHPYRPKSRHHVDLFASSFTRDNAL